MGCRVGLLLPSALLPVSSRRGGTEALENPRIFQVPVVRDAGGMTALQQAGVPQKLFTEAKRRMFTA